jgi:hypothetical protein
LYRAHASRPVSFADLVRVAGSARRSRAVRRRQELAALDDHQVRTWRSWRRWTLLAMLARDRVHERPVPPGVTAKGDFPTEQAALKTLYLVTRSLDPKGTGHARWITRWKPALNAFTITCADRMPAAENV